MKFYIQNNKPAWIVCGVSFAVAVLALVFLPTQIPIHFSKGVVDDYSGKIAIFLFPIIQVILLFCSNTKFLKEWTTKYKNGYVRSDFQYYLIVLVAILFILVAEIGVIAISLRG